MRTELPTEHLHTSELIPYQAYLHKPLIMSDPDIFIVIVTCNRAPLLARTLQTLSLCHFPENLRRVIVVENGATFTAGELVASFATTLPIEYRQFPHASKCGALNSALDETRNEFVIFFDDDVRIHEKTLLAYAEAAGGRRGGAFFGGRCLVDYEEPPEQWLKRYLPASARGWSLGSEMCPLQSPNALGFNWAAFSADLRSVGNFDERCGPGTDANGDERNVQERMLRRGIKGYFVPNATVWHHIPRERCSPAWALQQALRNARGAGLALAEDRRSTRCRKQLESFFKIAAYAAVLQLSRRWLRPKPLFHGQFMIQRSLGTLEGLKRARVRWQ